VLVGPSGAGKTTVGRLVAESLGAPVVDLDAEVERVAGKPVARIFAEDGEAAFRALESRCGAEVLAGEPAVVATGGGFGEGLGARGWGSGNALAVYLRVSPAVAATRLEGLADRPLLAGPDRVRTIAELLARREAAYLSAPHVVLTDGRTPAAIAAEVASLARDHAHW